MACQPGLPRRRRGSRDPTEVIVETAYRYLSAAERIMGRELDLQVGDVASRLEANLRRFLSQGR